jgi:Enoyl-CoA hydratase/carnithine racemase
MTTTSNEVLLNRSGASVTITINRPDRRNSVTLATAMRLHDVLQELVDDDGINVVLLRGNGADFCCGADFKSDTGGGISDENKMPIYQIPLLLHEMRAVTVAAVRGGCAGAGLGWAAACDLRIADPTAKFNSAFLDIGFSGDMSGPWSLSRILCSSNARDIYFLPRKFGAQEALQMGLISRIIPEAAFEEEVGTIVARLAAARPTALHSMKANFLDAERVGLREYVALETERHLSNMANMGGREQAFTAYRDKRAN